MASINLEKVKTLYGNSTDLQGQFIDYLRNVESELDFSKFEGLDDQAIFTNLMESGQKEIKVNPNNPAKPLNYRPRREQTYKELKALDDELKNQPFYKDLAMRATQVLDQINPTPFRQKELETRRHKAQEILNHLKRSGVTSEQFAKEYGDSPFLREAYFENQDIFSNIFDLSHDTSAALFGGKNAQAKAYDFELESYNTYKTLAQRKLDNPSNYYKLSPKERATIEQRVGAIGSWWRNNSDKELVDHYLDLENAKESASNFVSAQKRLENVNSNEQFLGLIGALKHGKEFDKKQKAMIDDYAIVAKELGFDTLAYNKTGLYFIKDEKAYKVEQGLWDEIKGVFKDNIGSLAGAIAGAEYGYKKGKFKGMVAYGAAGAFGGGVTDSMIADVLANKKLDLAQALIHGAQEGALNIAADAVLKVAGTAIKTLNPEKLKNIANTAIDYTPLLGFAKRAKDGNKAAAQKLIDHSIPQEAQADLKALESIFGAEVQIGATKVSQAQRAISVLESKLGSDSYIVKGAKSLYDTFAFTSQKQAQKDFIRAIRADESGNLSAFLSEAANASPVIQKNLLDILHQTSQKLAHQLGRFDLPPSTIKDVFDNFEKGTKQSYTDAIEQILLKVYDESYTTTLAKDSPNIPSNLSNQEAARFNTDSLEDFKAKMEKSGVLLEDSAKFLRFVESTIYNPKGVTFETLNNAQKTLNTYYKQASDPNFRSFVKDAVNGFIKRDIQAGIEKIFAQNAPLYNDARTLFDTALSDYAKMKETLKLADSLKIRDRRRSYEQVAQSLSRFFLGQGENIPNFEALLGGLQKELREQVELKLLQDMLELSFVKLNEIKVLDSSEFFKRLEPLKGHFHSTSAKDFIKIAQDFHTLFRNDASIARSLSPTTTEKIGTSIATTLEGAVKFQVIKALFANIIRLMPHIPFAKRLNESVQGSALRYQLKKALDSSLSVGEFKLELQARAIKGDFTNATREQIAKILGQVENAQESLEKATTPSTTPKTLDSSLKTSEIKQELLQRLEPILNKPLTNAQGVQAYINHASIDKMLSDKAIAKSVENGFSKQEHLEAVGDIERLFSISQEAATHSHKGDNPSVIIHRLNAPFNNANALITTKESLDKDKNRIYSVELELTPRFNTPARPTDTEASKGSSSSLNGQGGQDSPTIAKADQNNSTTLSPLEQAQAQKQAEQAAQEAAQQAQRQAEQEAAQAIKDKNDQIQNLKDSRAGKSEMEREVKIGEPIAMQRTEQPPTSIATDDNNIYQLDFVIVKAHDVKPNFNADGLQPRTQKEHKTIESIARDFKPEMVLGRGGYKDLPIIAKDGQVITGNHRVQGFKDFTQESRAAYEKAIKDRFNIELASDELLLRTPSDDLSVKELLSIAYNSNKEDIKNLGDHIYSVLGRYAPNFAKLPRQLESTSVQELKSKIARILDNSPYPNENDANLALLANTIKADKNANITEMLNAFSKLDKEDADKTLSTFTDTAGLWHILSNNAVEYGLKQLDLRPYLLGAMYKSATSQHTTRAANFKELNAQIKHILDTTDASGSNMMLEIMPNTYDNLIADLLGASLARFMRLENPSSNLYEALKGANSGIREQLAPRLDFEIGFTAGRNIEQADIFDFIEYLIRDGGEGKEVAEAVELLPKLREKYNAFKASTTPPNTPTPPTPPKDTLESQATKEAPKSLESPTSPTATPRILEREAEQAPKVDSSVAYTDTQGHTHQIPADIAQKWLETFGLKDLQETYTPQFSEQVAQALEPILQGEQITLSANSLVKLMQRDRLEFLPYIKETLEAPNAVVRQVDGALIFAKDYRDEKLGKFFASVSKNDKGEWIISSNAPKNLNNLHNKIKEGGKVLYSDLPELPIIAKPDLTAKALNSEANQGDIIPQSHTALSEQAQDHAHQILQGLRKTAQTPLNKLADEVPSTDRKFMIREAKYIKQQAKEFADNFANLRWQDLRSAIRYAKVPYDEAMFKELKESIESKEFARFIESSYPHKPPQKSLFDTQTPAETPAQKVDSSVESTPPKDTLESQAEQKSLFDTQEPPAPKVDSSVDMPKKSQREQVKQQLQSIKNIDITHKSGIVARLSSTGIDKMLSDKAIQKSLDNGFSQEQHFSAVADIERLFKNSDFSHTEAPKNQSADIVGIHRYINSQDLQAQNAQALITLKESIENGNRIYSVELEGLTHPSSVDRSPKSKGVENSHHDDAGATKAARLFENPSDTIPQKSLMNYTLLDNNLVEAIGQKIFRNYNKPYKERMSEIRDFFTLPKEHFTKILDKYKREVNSLEKGEIYNKIATTISIDEITDEITRSLKIKRERGYAAQAEKYFNELEEKAFHISKILQDMPYQIRDFIQNSAIDYKAAQWQKLLNTLDRLITRNNEKILENVQIRHKEYVKKFKNLATRNFSLWKNINALLNKEGIREVGDTLEVRNKNILDSIFKQTTPPSTPTPPKDTLESQATKEAPKSLESPTSPTATPRILEREAEQAPKVDSSESNHYAQREQTKAILEPLINKPITNQNDGRVAQISRKNIAKMTSDKAVAKSVSNGFEPAEHFKAVQEVDKLYQGSVFKQSEKDPKNNDPALIIHRYNAELDNANALITIKESLDKDQNRIYSLELESLEPKLSTKIHETKHNALDSSVSKDFDTSVDSNMSLNTAQDSTTKTFNQAQTLAREIPEQDLPYKRALKLKEELQTLKPLKRELSELKSSGKWRTKEGRAKRKELENIIKETEERGITPSKIEAQEIKDYEEFLQKYGDQEYFKELAQKTKELYIYNKEQSIRNHEQELNAPLPSPNWIKIVIPKEQKIKELDDLKNRPLDIDGEIFNIASKIVRLKNKLIDFTSNFEARRVFEKALGIKPIAEFGENYAEHYRDGVGAIEKLLLEKQGQVAGAFHRKELGDIDLVWGEVQGKGKEAKGWGLAKIIEKHGDEFENIAKELDEIIRDGEVVKTHNGYNIELGDYKVGLNIGWNENGVKIGENKWVVTAFDKSKLQSEKQGSNSASLTKGETLPFNSSDIIPQTTQAKQSGKSVAETKELIQKNKELQEANAQKIQEAKEKIKQLNKESRDLAYNAPTIMYLGRGYTKTRDKKYLDYKSRLSKKLEENGIHLDFMELEKLKQDTTLKGKARKEAMDTIYLRMYENMQQADKETKERVRAFSQKIREEELQEAKEWLEKNKGASSDVDYEYKRKIAEIDKQLVLAFKKNTKDTEFIDLMNRQRGTLTYAKNGDLGVVRLPELEKFYPRGYPMDLKVLRDIQKEHNYTDKNLILNGRDFSKSFEVMRAEIEARIGIKPIKEFGTNYAEHYHSGESAIAKLLNEKQGQVAGAFHRKELGDIDLVWGDSSFGLAHIIERRMQDFINQGMSHEQAEQAVKELLDQIPQILEGQIYKDSVDKVEIITDKYTLVIGKRDDRKFIITELIDRRNKKRMEAMQTRVGDSFTDEPLAKSPLSSNRSDSTTKTFNQADIKLESLDDFASYARLAGFENLSQEQLESAHKHILANLEKLRC